MVKNVISSDVNIYFSRYKNHLNFMFYLSNKIRRSLFRSKIISKSFLFEMKTNLNLMRQKFKSSIKVLKFFFRN